MAGKPNYDDDAVFVRAIENLSLPKEHFDHRGHLRLAFLYLREDSFTDAMNRIRDTIQAYATSLGAADKYHETITALFMSLISARMRDTDQDWQAFIARHPELSDQRIITRHLPKSVLTDPRARTEIVFPTIRPSEQSAA